MTGQSPTTVDCLGLDVEDPADKQTDLYPGDDCRAEPPGGIPPVMYGPVEDFVLQLLSPTSWRKVDGRSATWCPEWQRHSEAVVRLEALRRSWEHLRRDPTLGMSTWLRDHLDHHLPVLLAPDGPFRECTPGRRHNPSAQPLPVVGIS
jgi:hypothetical protein